MLALSPKARRHTRVVGIVCASYGIAMLMTHAYVSARQARKTSTVAFHEPTIVPTHRVAKRTKTKAPSATESPAIAASMPAQTQHVSPAPPQGSQGGGPPASSPPVASASTAEVSTNATASFAIPPSSGTAPSGQTFIFNRAPGMVQGARPDYRGPVAFRSRPPNYPRPQSNRPPPSMPRGASQAPGGNRQAGPPSRSRP